MDIVQSEQGYFVYDVEKRAMTIHAKIISKLLTIDKLLEKLKLKFDLKLKEND